MKRIKKFILMLILILVTGCKETSSMDGIQVLTSTYPLQYVVSELYKDHCTITSLYPMDSEISEFKVTNTLLRNYSSNDLFVFNGLTNESSYVKTMLKENKKIKIIDTTSNINYENSIEELWLDPNNLLTIANNIKKGLSEYIDATYLVNEINDNYNILKINLTSIDGSYYSTVKNASNTTIIVTDDAFKYLEKYGITVISLDKDTATQKDFSLAKEAIEDEECYYIFKKYKEEVNNDVKELIDETNANILELYTMTNLSDIEIDKINYITLLNENLDNLKKELYK